MSFQIGDINALVQDELSGQLKDSLKLESSPSKMPMNKHENKEYQVIMFNSIIMIFRKFDIVYICLEQYLMTVFVLGYKSSKHDRS